MENAIYLRNVMQSSVHDRHTFVKIKYRKEFRSHRAKFVYTNVLNVNATCQDVVIANLVAYHAVKKQNVFHRKAES